MVRDAGSIVRQRPDKSISRPAVFDARGDRMVVWCNDCHRYVNQICNKCGDNFGLFKCEKYACGGIMICPQCGGSNLAVKAPEGSDPLGVKFSSMERAGPHGDPTKCHSCGYPLQDIWKFCPICGVKIYK